MSDYTERVAPHELLEQPYLESPIMPVSDNNVSVDIPIHDAPTQQDPSYVIPQSPPSFSLASRRAEHLRKIILYVSVLTLITSFFYLVISVMASIVYSDTYLGYDFPNAIANLAQSITITAIACLGIAASSRNFPRGSVYRLLYIMIVGLLFCLGSYVIMTIFCGFVTYLGSYVLTLTTFIVAFFLYGGLIACVAFRMHAMKYEDIELSENMKQQQLPLSDFSHPQIDRTMAENSAAYSL